MLGVRDGRPRVIVRRRIVKPQMVPAHTEHGRTIFRAMQVCHANARRKYLTGTLYTRKDLA
jgi:hypothetical protein